MYKGGAHFFSCGIRWLGTGRMNFCYLAIQAYNYARRTSRFRLDRVLPQVK